MNIRPQAKIFFKILQIYYLSLNYYTLGKTGNDKNTIAKQLLLMHSCTHKMVLEEEQIFNKSP